MVQSRDMGVSVLIVDDHPLFRHGMQALLAREGWCTDTRGAGTVEEALDCCTARVPGLLILDLSLGEQDAMGFLKDLHVMFPAMPVLVVSMHDENLYAFRSLKAGARGYLMKSASPDRLMEAMRTVLQGKISLSPAMRECMMDTMSGNGKEGGPGDLDSLSDRELEVLRLVGRGFGTREIAGMLHLSAKTVDTHRENMKIKLGMANSRALVRYAMAVGNKL